MDGSRFDAWVRSWAATSRRGVIRLVSGGGLAALTAKLGLEDAAAKCVSPGKKCKTKNGKKKKCCGGAKCKGKKCKCQDGTFACGKHCCIPGQLCQPSSGVLTCANGSIPIQGECDPEQPGACASGVCGCGPGGCTCRKEDCAPPGGDCSDGGNPKCCDGLCFAGMPPTCDLTP